MPGCVDSEAQIHILCIFASATTDTDIRMVIRDAGRETWQPGKPIAVKDLPEFVQGLRQHAEWPAICIAAHVSSAKGVQKETKNAILSHIRAELSRLEGERQSGREPDIRSIDQQVEALKQQRESGRRSNRGSETDRQLRLYVHYRLRRPRIQCIIDDSIASGRAMGVLLRSSDLTLTAPLMCSGQVNIILTEASSSRKQH